MCPVSPRRRSAPRPRRRAKARPVFHARGAEDFEAFCTDGSSEPDDFALPEGIDQLSEQECAALSLYYGPSFNVKGKPIRSAEHVADIMGWGLGHTYNLISSGRRKIKPEAQPPMPLRAPRLKRGQRAPRLRRATQAEKDEARRYGT